MTTPNDRFRDRVLTAAASALARSVRPLWYAEQLVLSARYQQALRGSDWSRDSRRCRDRLHLWENVAFPRLRRGGSVALEFGVADGAATHWWAATGAAFVEWHGFDTFEGLPEPWKRGGVEVMAAGVFSPEGGAGAVPQVSAAYPVIWHRGLIQETLASFTRPESPLFVLIDVDLHDPAVTVLEWLREHGRPGDLIYFDEAFDPWNEGLALRQSLDAGLRLRALAHTGSALLVELT